MSRPEVRIALFGFLAAFLWEMWQMPFYATAGLTVAEAVRGCSLGSLGDSGLMVLAYSVGSIATGNRHWVRQWTPTALAAYLGTGLLATIVVEMIVEGRAWGWHYAPLMPREPLTGVGLVPIAMWIAVPLFTLWLSRNLPPRKSLNR
ncbi:MAG: hypothetical protein COW16_12635 [Sphingomonadales bacterium CG12_big_fil_rev_8_21_14_0_65_65_10]|nr:MAG: hypothetical protein COW16_12635 [Sphingomonadales bacterium CG12_big_fil_rev_8_21_14_0_65_65_10]